MDTMTKAAAGRLGGQRTLALYGPTWFSALNAMQLAKYGRQQRVLAGRKGAEVVIRKYISGPSQTTGDEYYEADRTAMGELPL